MAEYRVSGPYHYSGDLHPSFRIDTEDRLIAAVYIVDEPDEIARQRAETMARALGSPIAPGDTG